MTPLMALTNSVYAEQIRLEPERFAMTALITMLMGLLTALTGTAKKELVLTSPAHTGVVMTIFKMMPLSFL